MKSLQSDWSRASRIFAAAFAVGMPAWASALCLAPPGDVNASGYTNVADIHCLILVGSWQTAGGTGSPPSCLKVALTDADLNCDGTTDIADIQLAIYHALELGLPGQVDVDGNGCYDECELGPDTDEDGVPDTIDCQPNDPAVYPGKSELCNGFDDNCNGSTDEGFSGMGQPCDGDGDGCVTGVRVCAQNGASVMCEEPQGAALEQCDGTDDDGDGCVDEGYFTGALCDGLDGDVCEDGTQECSGGVAQCTDSPVLRWSFEDGPGSATVTDGSGHGHDGSLIGGPTWGAGAEGGALSFQNDQWVDGGDVDLVGGSQQATWAAWVRSHGAVDSSYQAIISTWNAPTSGLGYTWSFALRADGVSLRLRTSELATFPTEYRCHTGLPGCGPLVALGGWAHVAATFDHGAVALYVNGQLAKSFVAPGSRIALPGLGQRVLVAGENTGTSNSFHGEIDELIVLPSALGPEALQALYQLGHPAIDNVDVCNQLDDDCDGQIDEDALPFELCNGVDDDCDGETDEGFAVGDVCDGEDGDFCANGTYGCAADGLGVVCGAESPANVVEVCNGVDDDCDGQVDDGFSIGAPCDGADNDSCANGTYTCSVAGGVECVNESISGVTESCNLADDDCDGQTDEDFPSLGQACDGDDSDSCANGVVECRADGAGVECGVESAIDVAELCNGLDDDCDGNVDEDFDGLGEECDGPDGDACANGWTVCNAAGDGTECSAELPAGIMESCNGLDDDCDGATDEDFPLLGSACDGGDDDECSDGRAVCAPDGAGVTCDDGSGVILLFDEGSGGVAIDATAGGGDGVFLGGAHWTTASKSGAFSLTLPGHDTESMVAVPGDAIASTTFTFAAWIFPIFDPAATVEQCFLSRTSAFSDNGVSLCIDGTLWFEENYSPGVVAPINQWTHVALTYDGAELKVYANGAAAKTIAVTKPFLTWTSDLYIGQEQDCINGCFDADQAFKGRIDEVMWLTRALSGGEVASIAAAGIPEEWLNYEFCDAHDNDCDGLVDEAHPVGEACDGSDGDLCANGSWTCALGGAAVECSNETVEGIAELCNGMDDDCDGQTDEDFPVALPCDGPDADACPYGVRVCSADELSTECQSDEPSDVEEICNGVDDDCDGVTDEGFVELGSACDGPDGDLCQNGIFVCTSDGFGTECSVETQTDIEESCNTIDDDCDGLIDEGFPTLGAPCDGPDADECVHGVITCTADGTGVECGVEAPSGLEELCNGFDDDCDQAIDEDFPELGAACDGDDPDQCVLGTVVCAPDGSGVVCGGEDPAGVTEVCNGVDDDCDGFIDEAAEPTVLASCDDLDPCTVDACIAEACAHAPNGGAACDDGDACTSGDTCNGSTCAPGAPVSCDDSNVCTIDTCAPATGCVFTDDSASCADGNPCTHDYCDAVAGCGHVPANLPCDDGDPCTLADACFNGTCLGGAPNLDCTDPPGVICEVHGPAGTQVACPLRMARRSALIPGVTGLQFDVYFKASALQVVQLQDDICFDENSCVVLPTPPFTLYPTSHTVSVNPVNPAVWAGQGRVVIAKLDVEPGEFGAAITDAYRQAGVFFGEPTIAELLVQLAVDVPANAPAVIALGGVRGASAVPELLPGAVEEGVMIIGEGDDCIGNAAACDDANPCTDDSCEEGSDTCLHIANAMACDDGDSCTVGDVCSAGTCTGGPTIDLSCVATAGAFCALWGPAGTEVSCPLRLVHAEIATLHTGAVGFDVLFDAGVAETTRLWTTVCDGGGSCMEVDTPPASLGSGHSVLVGPTEVGEWSGAGNVLVVHVTEPWLPLTDAYLSGGSVVGDDILLWVDVRLVSAVDKNAPAVLRLDGVSASRTAQSTFDVIEQDASMAGGRIVVSDADCTNDPEFVCNDDNPCTDEACSGGECAWAPNTAACDDGEACTLDDTCSAGACAAGAGIAPECTQATGDVCALWGAAGTTATCELRLVRADDATPAAQGIDFELTYAAAVVRVVRLWDELCFAETCIEAELPGDALLPSGHTVALSPAALAEWSGVGGVLVANFTDPATPLSTAFRAGGGTIEGDSQLMYVELELLQPAPFVSPALVLANDLDAFYVVPPSGAVEALDAVVAPDGAIEVDALGP